MDANPIIAASGDAADAPPPPLYSSYCLPVGVSRSSLSSTSLSSSKPQDPSRHQGRRGSLFVGEAGENGSWPPQEWPVADSLSFTRNLVFEGEGMVTTEHEAATKLVQEARAFRRKYHGGEGVAELSDLGPDAELRCSMGRGGVASLSGTSGAAVSVPPLEDFVRDYDRLVAIASDGVVRSFCFQRLELLDLNYKRHLVVNGPVEHEAQMALHGTDFYSTMKVDNHIHLAAAASAKIFADFVRGKLATESETVVHDGKTLGEVFDQAGLDSENLTVDKFNVLADYSVYKRFDNFNGKYSPFRLGYMRKIFLKTENDIDGRYFAELTKIIFARHENNKGHKSATEMRLSIYGMERVEWLHLARWVMRDWEGGENPGPVLSSHNRYLVQVPRLWRIYRAKKIRSGPPGGRTVTEASFQDMLENIFVPMFEATLHPEKEENQLVAQFLEHVVGFDSVDDEGAPEDGCSCVRANAWRGPSNPHYAWQLYYLWANIEVLNRLRRARGLNTFSLRPHAGETGDAMHLAASYLLSNSINHGVNLDRQVSLQYFYYLDQVGLSMSPLSNNFLFHKMATNPLPKFFRRGLNVTLSTDDPLLFHMSDDALLEEYSVARASYDLSMTDISELARNSVLQSGFEDRLKREWLGEHYAVGVTQCDARRTHVPLIRAKYRAEQLALEEALISILAAGRGKDYLAEVVGHFSSAREAHREVLARNGFHIPHSL